ncbi:MAG: HlyD family efflux transporter periplasmic adaptor subunit [Candidatus Hydrogenedentes bacterium]|nr:HlyD family efflux transporter periplasmic adaptor subunit [Candidatus Hydrogenedentota bacterium]
MKGRLAALFFLVLLSAAVAGLGWLLVQPRPRLLQGEVDTRKISVSAKIPGRVEEMLAEEGGRLKKGDVIAVLDSPQLQAKRQQAGAVQEAAGAQRDKAEGGAREEQIRMAQSQWLQAQAGAELAEKSFARVERLFNDGVVPAQRRDEVQAQRDMARKLVEAAKAQYDMALNGAQEEDRRAAQALVNQAAGAVSEVESLIGEARVTAPMDGEIVEHIVSLGELAAAGMPIVTMINPDDCWVTFSVREDWLGGMKLGDRLTGRVPALNGAELEMEVSYLAPLGDFATWRATNIAGGFDLKTFEVRARPVTPAEGLRPGMSVVVPWGEEPQPDPLAWLRRILTDR